MHLNELHLSAGIFLDKIKIFTLFQKLISRTFLALTLNFPGLPRSQCLISLLSAITSYFCLEFNTFPEPVALVQDFPVLENATIKFQVFQDPFRPCCIDRLLISPSKQNCESLTYLTSDCDERLLRTGKVSVIASEVRNIGKKSISSMKATPEIIPKRRKILSTSGSVQKLSVC